MYIYIIYIYINIYIGGFCFCWGREEPGNCFVSCRACVRACARCGRSPEISAKTYLVTFPFSLLRRRPFPFPLGDHTFPFPL